MKSKSSARLSLPIRSKFSITSLVLLSGGRFRRKRLGLRLILPTDHIALRGILQPVAARLENGNWMRIRELLYMIPVQMVITRLLGLVTQPGQPENTDQDYLLTELMIG